MATSTSWPLPLAARAWSAYEGSCSTLLPSPETVQAFSEDRMALGLARLRVETDIGVRSGPDVFVRARTSRSWALATDDQIRVSQMLRYGVDDLRSFFENDVRFLRQFA